MDPLILILIIAVGFGLSARYVAIQKGREPAEGWWFGFLLGPIGLFVELFLPTLPTKPIPTSHVISSSPDDGPHFGMVGEKHPAKPHLQKTKSVLNLR